jgi:two-component system chemotaxis response regulator CheB
MSLAPTPLASNANAPARVMICDDSAVIRAAISRSLESDPAIRVIARVANGQAALDALKLYSIDVVVLDIEMPVMDGLTALPELLRADPGLRVIMASTLTTRGADIALRALRLGAADYIPKPSANSLSGDQHFAAELMAKIKGLTRLRRAHGMARPATAPGSAMAVTTRAVPATAKPAQYHTLSPAPRQKPKILAIASSTGGPNALFSLIPALGKLPHIPIVITQHMPPNFTAMLAGHIAALGIMPCHEAQHGAILRPGEIILAPGGAHLLIKRGANGGFISELSQDPPENFCRPAADPMLRSLTDASDGAALVIILTGMGQDGLLGTRALVRAGGAAIAQDEASSVVWGMPGAIARDGLAHAILPLSEIGAKTRVLLGER